MPKETALRDNVTVNAIDLSNFARAVVFSSEQEKIDVSGFSATGTNEYIAGPTEQTVTVTFYGTYGTGEVHATLYPLHKNRTIFAFKWRKDGSTVVGATNPELRGNAQLLTYGSPNRTRGEAETWDAVLSQCDAAGFDFFTT